MFNTIRLKTDSESSDDDLPYVSPENKRKFELITLNQEIAQEKKKCQGFAKEYLDGINPDLKEI